MREYSGVEPSRLELYATSVYSAVPTALGRQVYALDVETTAPMAIGLAVARSTQGDSFSPTTRTFAESERPDKAHRALEKRDLPHGKTWRHHERPQSSALWLKKCLRMRCTSSVKAGSAITSSERGRGSGTS